MKSIPEFIVTLVSVALLHEPFAKTLYEYVVMAAFPAAAVGAVLRVYREESFTHGRRACFAAVRQHAYLFVESYCIGAALLRYVPWSGSFFTIHLGCSWYIYECFNSVLAYLSSPLAFPLLFVVVLVGGPSLMATWLIWSFWVYFMYGWVQFVILGGAFALLTGAFPAWRVLRVFSPISDGKPKALARAPRELEEDQSARGLGYAGNGRSNGSSSHPELARQPPTLS